MSVIACRLMWPLVVIAVLTAGCSKEAPTPPQRPAPEVTVISVETRDIPYIADFVAQTESSRQVNIVARVSGFSIASPTRKASSSSRVSSCSSSTPSRSRRSSTPRRASSQSQQARLATAQATYGRVKPLAEQDALPHSDLDRAQGRARRRDGRRVLGAAPRSTRRSSTWATRRSRHRSRASPAARCSARART